MANKLSEDMIYECLKSLSVPVRKQDIKTPTPEFMYRVLECFLIDLQIDITSPNLRTWAVMEHIQELDIYEDAINLLILVLTINHIFNPCGMKISIRDITEPKPKRTKKHLNYLIHFWNYFLKKYERFRKTEEIFEAERQRFEDKVLDLEVLDEKYRDILNVLENMEPSKDKLLSSFSKRSEKIENLNTKKEKMMSEYQALKSEEIELRNEINAVQISIVSAKEKLSDLNEVILASPDRFKKDIEKLHESIKTKDLKIKNTEKELKELKKKLEDEEKSLENYNKSLITLKENHEDLNQLCKEIEEFSIDAQKLLEEEKVLKELQMETDKKAEWNSLHEQKSAQMLIQNMKHKESLNEVLNELKRDIKTEENEYKLLKKTEKQLRQSVDSERNELMQMKKEYEVTKCEVDEKIAEYRKKYKEHQGNFCVNISQLKDELEKKFMYSEC